MKSQPDPEPAIPRTTRLRDLIVCTITAVVSFWLLESWPEVKAGFTDGFLAGWNAVSR